MSTRVTTFRIDAFEAQTNGALKVDARLTKTGVFDYQDSEGNLIREMRPDEEVFKERSLESLHGAPVTLLHPSSGFVDTKTWDLLSIGTVIKVASDDPYVDGTLLIHDERAIEQIKLGKLKEVSCGYSANVVPAPEGETRFDAVQTDISYNHCAVGPHQWARLGTDVALRLDSNDNIILEGIFMPDEEKPVEEEATAADDEQLKADQADETETEEAPEDVAVLKATIDELVTKISALEARLDSEEPAEEVSAEDVEEAHTYTEEELQQLVDSKVAFSLRVRKAHSVLCPEQKQDGREDRDLCVEGLKAVDVDPQDYADDALLGMLETAAKTSAKVAHEVKADSKPTFAERLTKSRTETPKEQSFSERLVTSIN